MSRLLITSDLHLGHNSIAKYRTNFSSAEEHHNIIFDSLASEINKRDSIIFLGDVAFDLFWLDKIKNIKCKKKLLICGNHDLDYGIKMRDLVNSYNDVKSLYSLKGCWLSHCPIHFQEMRNKQFNIHGHLHQRLIKNQNGELDKRYINVCVEHTDYKPVDLNIMINKLRNKTDDCRFTQLHTTNI